MKTILAATGLALVLLIPTGATAKPDKSKRDAKNAFGKCVSRKARGGS